MGPGSKAARGETRDEEEVGRRMSLLYLYFVQITHTAVLCFFVFDFNLGQGSAGF